MVSLTMIYISSQGFLMIPTFVLHVCCKHLILKWAYRQYDYNVKCIFSLYNIAVLRRKYWIFIILICWLISTYCIIADRLVNKGYRLLNIYFSISAAYPQPDHCDIRLSKETQTAFSTTTLFSSSWRVPRCSKACPRVSYQMNMPRKPLEGVVHNSPVQPPHYCWCCIVLPVNLLLHLTCE